MTVALDFSSHAVSRMVEFGIGEDVVADIVDHPTVCYPSRVNHGNAGTIHHSDRFPQWAVVADAQHVITILRRTAERWQHGEPSSAAPVHAVEDDRPALPPPARAVARRRPVARQPRGAVTRVAVDPLVLATARELVGGDVRRLVLNGDGTVTVLNHARSAR